MADLGVRSSPGCCAIAGQPKKTTTFWRFLRKTNGNGFTLAAILGKFVWQEKIENHDLKPFPDDLELLLRAEPGKMDLPVSIGIFGSGSASRMCRIFGFFDRKFGGV